MASTLVFCGLGAWTLLALAVAIAAWRKGLSFIEFFAYAMVALPFALLYVKTCPNTRRKAGGDSPRPAQPAGRVALQMVALTAVVALGGALAKGPGHFVANLEAVAQYGLHVDDCAAENPLSDCMPSRPVSLVGDVVASTLPATWRVWEDDIAFTASPAAEPAMARRAAPSDGEETGAETSPLRAPVRIAALDAGETLALKAPEKPAAPVGIDPVRAAYAEAKAAADEAGPVQPEDIRRTQNYLTALGFEPGPIDGIYGRKTASAIESFEKAHGFPVAGDVSAPLLAALEQDLHSARRKTAGADRRQPEVKTASTAPTRLTRSAAAPVGTKSR